MLPKFIVCRSEIQPNICWHSENSNQIKDQGNFNKQNAVVAYISSEMLVFMKMTGGECVGLTLVVWLE